MNLYHKLRFYLMLKRKNYRRAFITAFTNNKLQPLDYYFITLLIVGIFAWLTIYFAESLDNAFAESEKRAVTALKSKTEAYKRLKEREYIIAHMLNGNYIRLDGVKRKVKLCDASGDCDE